ncbi:hypothetical protein RDI58_025713 [Solanum bulbocastanum]|uniref:Zeatin O-xylosyltransferase n=1 Tax=Solanum bulbocastanum TaxID=147425 RepID=A0AAN8T1X8_SOLBU
MYSLFWEMKGKPFQAGTALYKGMPSLESCCTKEIWEFWRKQESVMGKVSSGELYNSSRNKDSNKHHQSLYWLDKQETNSVIYVSFGTSTSLSNEEIEELAFGLEKSMQKFIWVLRDVDRGDVFADEERKGQLPEGYEERIKGRGIIVRDWAPQLEILAHLSTDQPRNSQIVTKFLKIGLIVRHWACRDELVISEIVENAVRTLMASPEGDDMRKRASELSNVAKQSAIDGGVNSAEMDSFITHITR